MYVSRLENSQLFGHLPLPYIKCNYRIASVTINNTSLLEENVFGKSVHSTIV